MNILVLTTKLPYPPKDGGAIATINMAVGLADLGCKVTILAMNTTKHYFPSGKIPRELQEKMTFHTVDVDTRIRWTALLWNFFFSQRPYHSIRFMSRPFQMMLQELLANDHFDIVQFEGPYLGYCLPLIRKSSKAKLSFRAHNIEHEIWNRRASHTKNPFRRFYFSLLSKRIKKLESSFIQLVDIVIPISDRDYKIFLQLGLKSPSLVCPAGIDIPAYPDPAPISAISFSFIGALDWGPNTDGLEWFLTHVWQQLTTLYPGLKIHVAGRNPNHYSPDDTRIPGMKMEGEVEDASRFINSHPIMVVPLFSGSGIRIKILEAMLLGRTVISTSIGAEGLDVIHGKNIFIANTPAEFINCAGILISNMDLLQTTGTEARRFIKENFDNLVIVKKLAHFYKENMK